MIHVGASAGAFDFVPTSSSTRTRQYSQLAAPALTGSRRSTTNEAVLAYHASPSRTRASAGRNAGHVHFTAPSAWN